MSVFPTIDPVLAQRHATQGIATVVDARPRDWRCPNPAILLAERRRFSWLGSCHSFPCHWLVEAGGTPNINENVFEVSSEVVTDDATSGFARSLSTNERFRNFASALDE